MQEKLEQVFYEIFNNLPQKGPGSFESTQKAYGYVKDYFNKPKILDLGCGSGRQTLDLLSVSDGYITAVDNYPPYINELNSKIREKGYSSRAYAELGDMFNPEFPDNSFDIIWSEGAIYIVGFEKGITDFKRILKPGGFIVASELSWLVEIPSSAPYDFWSKDYPGIGSVKENEAIIENSGYQNLAQFTLPESDWINNYYSPLQLNLDKMKLKYASDSKALEIIEAEQYEIELYKKYSHEYGYVFYIMKKSG